MGVDYDGVAGLGIMIENCTPDEYDSDMELFLDEKFEGSDFYYKNAGNAYTDDGYDYYVFIPIPGKDEDWAKVPEKRDALLKYLKECGIETKGEFGLIEDLLVW